jgi:uncharacterized membrane protein YdjX (TVP38/TMEM64 family)
MPRRIRERVRRARARARAAPVALIRLGLLALGLLALWLGLRIAGVDLSVDAIEDWGEDLGAAGLIGFVPAVIALNCVFVIPIPVAAAAGGLLFGIPAGAALTTVAAAGSAGVQNAIGRRWVGARMEHLLGERGKRFDDLLDRRGFEAIFYARLTPFTPFTALNYASGVTRLRAWPMALASGLAMGPRIYAYTTLGHNIDDLWSPDNAFAFAIIAVSTVIGIALITHAGLRHRRGRRAADGPQPGEAAG